MEQKTIQHSYFVLTDSGGIQEEAPSLGKPVIVMRNVTERMEGVLAGNAILSGTNITDLIRCMEKLIMSDSEYKKINQKIVSLYTTLIQNHVLPYSIVGKIGLIGPRLHQDLFQNYWNELKQ